MAGRPAVVMIICPCLGISFSASAESSVCPLPEAVLACYAHFVFRVVCAVSSRFSGGSTTATVLEIYAPKDYTRGAYINDFSYFNGESEILLDGGTEFKVVDEYDFTIFHMFGEDRGQIVAGDVEGPLRYNKTDKGIEVIITSLSPFAIHWSKNISDSQESQEGEEDKDTAKPSDNGNNDNKKETAKNILTGDPVSVFLYTSIMLVSLAIALVCFIYGRKNKKVKCQTKFRFVKVKV